jgi:RND family efflux transporter MFP subunit
MNRRVIARRIALLVIGAAGVVLAGGRVGTRASLAAAVQETGASPSDLTVSIPADVAARAGIATTPARRGQTADGLSIPATVEPNAYRQVAVVSTSAGQVLSVPAELGQRVQAGDRLLQIHSPEVAETERTYVSRQADLTFARLQVTRLERLVAIGAASQQELDAAHAEETGIAADVEGARAQLLLLGRSGDEVAALTGPQVISPVVTVIAPMAGTVTVRSANPGETIKSGAPLITIVDLDTVWIIGDAYERDLASVREGNAATVTSPALGSQALVGRITYIDPQIAPASRTARVRVEVPNPGGRLRLGMLVDMRVGTGTAAETVVVPRSAVQTVGRSSVVYVADTRRPGTFSERSVRLGGASGDDVQVVAGLAVGEPVVSTGSFFVRSERDRLSLAEPRPAPPVPVARPQAAEPQKTPEPKPIDIAITEKGFTPPEVNVPANTTIRLRFTRRVEKTCATEVVFPALKIEKELPLNVAVIIDVPPQPAGRLTFACGMDMYRGAVVIK